jgi:hypothetical protein
MLNASPEMLAELKWWLYCKAGSGACIAGEQLVTVWHCHIEANGDCRRNKHKTVRFVGSIDDLIQYCTAALPGITVES